VGKWRVERPPPTVPNLFNEVEFTFYGAVIQRVRDSTTGAVLYEESMPETQWRVSEGRFQQVANGNLLVRWLKGIRGPTLHWDHALSWEGPARLRLENPAHHAPVIVLVKP
jgi:hypothetical protein